MEQVMDILLSIGALAFVFIAIGFCIFSHELGHFLAAKWRGMHIDAFSLGFRPFWKKKINGHFLPGSCRAPRPLTGLSPRWPGRCSTSFPAC